MYSPPRIIESRIFAVILAPAKISAYAVRQLSSRRIRVLFQEPHRRHDEPRHAERALESLLIHHCLLHRMQRPVRRRQAFDRRYLLAAHRVRQHRAAIVRHIVKQHRASAALRAIASQLRSRQPQLVAQCKRQRLLLHHFHAARLPIHVERDQPFAPGASAAAGRKNLVARGAYNGAAGNHAQDEPAPGD